ncbi:MAG: NAD(P)/FAD-dependent oxidoreductase [Chloroflexi bacterium]|nr:NAD(P)/FAD-dependent oxidoreductase [Chloroflexota bacterium]
MDPEYDAIIVGGRVAGAITGALLGKKGHRVLILEKARFPSDTLSTHFFRAPALRAFSLMGVYEEIQATAPHLMVNYNVVDEIVFPEPVEGPDDYPFYMCVRRITLDGILARRAKETPGVTFIEGAKVESVLWEGDAPGGVAWKVGLGKFSARAKAIIGADGINSFLARQVSIELEEAEPVNRAMYYAYYSGLDAKDGPAAEFHYRGNTLVYVFPCDGGLTLTAVSVPITEFQAFRRDPQRRMTEELNAMTQVAGRLEKAKRVGSIKGSGSIPGYLRVPYGRGWALVGDAGMVMDPWSGQGIDQAATHAVFLADELARFLTGEASWNEAMQAYHEARNGFSLKTYQRTCTFSRDLRPMTLAALQRRDLA